MPKTVTLSRCACGHIAEWHYRVHRGGALILPSEGAPPLSGRVRCPSPVCDCTEVSEPREPGPTVRV